MSPPRGDRDDEPSAVDRRWPRSVYGEGTEPDPRFTFANERTYLAWIRTALAFIAAGVALTAYAEVTNRFPWPALVAALLLIICGVGCGVGALLNWMRNEKSMRIGRPLPSSPLLPLLAGTLVVFAVAAIVLAW